MRATRLVAGAALIGGVWLNFVGLDQVVVAADASPIVVATEQDPSGPTFTVEPATPAAPPPDIVGDSGIVSSTDSGSAIPGGSLPEASVGDPSELAPVLDVPSGSPPIEVAAGPTVSPAPDDAPGFSPNPVPGDPDGPPAGPEHPCHPIWCPRPPDPPTQPPWPGPDPFWPETSDTWEFSAVPLSPCVQPPPPDASPPPPLQYGGQTVFPAFDGGLRQWGFVLSDTGCLCTGPNARRLLVPSLQHRGLATSTCGRTLRRDVSVRPFTM